MSENNGAAGRSSDGQPDLKVDLNGAELDELTSLPGVGPAMAERIVAGRPYSDIDSLQNVDGIGPALLEQMRPYITIPETAAVDQTDGKTGQGNELAADLEGQTEVEAKHQSETEAELPTETQPVAVIDVESEPQPETEPAAEIKSAAETEVEQPPASPDPALDLEGRTDVRPEGKDPAPTPVTRSQAVILAVGSGLLAFFLALILSLAIMAGINRGALRYATPAEIAAVSRQFDALSGQAEMLQGDIAGMRLRLDNLEALGVRIEAVEEISAQLEGDLAAAEEQLTEIGRRSEILAEQVGELEGQNERFQTFFIGLDELLETIFGSEEGVP